VPARIPPRGPEPSFAVVNRADIRSLAAREARGVEAIALGGLGPLAIEARERCRDILAQHAPRLDLDRRGFLGHLSLAERLAFEDADGLDRGARRVLAQRHHREIDELDLAR